MKLYGHKKEEYLYTEDTYLNKYYKGLITRCINLIDKLFNYKKLNNYTALTAVKKIFEIIETQITKLSVFYKKEDYKDFFYVILRVTMFFDVLREFLYDIKDVMLRTEVKNIINVWTKFENMWARDIDDMVLEVK